MNTYDVATSEIATGDVAIPEYNYPTYVPDDSYFPSGYGFDYPNGDDSNIVGFNDRWLSLYREERFLSYASENPDAVSIGQYMFVQTKCLTDIKAMTTALCGIVLFVVFTGFFRRMFHIGGDK